MPQKGLKKGVGGWGSGKKLSLKVFSRLPKILHFYACIKLISAWRCSSAGSSAFQLRGDLRCHRSGKAFPSR